MTLPASTPVLIAGAGPVGLSVACELAWRGVDCIVVDQSDGANIHPRANVLQVRCQEIFRRWGIMDRVIEGGYPEGYPGDFVFTTRVCDHEVFRFRFPSYAEATGDRAAFREAYPEVDHSPGYKFYIGQNALEPILCDFAVSTPHAAVHYGWRVSRFEDTGGQVDVELENVATGARHTIAADYLVGCDGGRSTVRKGLGFDLEGMATIGEYVGIYFRAPDFYALQDKGQCALYWSIAPSASGVFIPIDGREHFNYQKHLRPNETADDVDALATISNAFGRPLDAEIITVQPWSGHALVAPRYQRGRVLLAGDAAHLFVPTGGFGMNTGIVDGVDLGIRLAGVLQGWAGRGYLEHYSTERQPVAVRNAREAADNYFEITPCVMAPAQIERDDEAGSIVRSKYARNISQQRKHFNAFGITLGYRYDRSPLIVPDGTPAVPDDPQQYVPTTRPGSRAPHVWLADGRSILDLFGRTFVLLRLGPDAPDAAAFVAAAEACGLPFDVQAVDEADVVARYETRLVLVRPDGLVAWRGNAMPADPRAILDTARGAAPAPVSAGDAQPHAVTELVT